MVELISTCTTTLHVVTFLSRHTCHTDVCRAQNVLFTVLTFVVLHVLLTKIHKSSSPAGFWHSLLMFAAQTHRSYQTWFSCSSPHSPSAVDPLPDHLPSPLLLLLPLLHRRRGYFSHIAVICPLPSSPPHLLSWCESINSYFAIFVLYIYMFSLCKLDGHILWIYVYTDI